LVKQVKESKAFNLGVSLLLIGTLLANSILKKDTDELESETDRVNNAHYFRVIEQEEKRLKAEEEEVRFLKEDRERRRQV
jgi:hypothetical protein